MPYQSIDELPESEVGDYDEAQRRAFLQAYQEAYEAYKQDEQIALVSGHTAAKEMRKRPADSPKGTGAKNEMLSHSN